MLLTDTFREALPLRPAAPGSLFTPSHLSRHYVWHTSSERPLVDLAFTLVLATGRALTTARRTLSLNSSGCCEAPGFVFWRDADYSQLTTRVTCMT